MTGNYKKFTLADLMVYGRMQEYEEYIKSKAESTKENYHKGIVKYCNYTGMTPDELIAEADEDTKNGVLTRERRIKKRVLGFRNWLDDDGNAINTRINDFSGVSSFYRCFEIQMPQLPAWEKSQVKPENYSIPTIEEIREAIKVCSTRNKAIIVAGCSSGLAGDDLLNLKVQQFKEGYDQETGITTLVLRRGKTKQDFITCFSPEASGLIWQYLKERDNGDEKQRVTDESYLFVQLNTSNAYLDSYDEELRKIDTDGLHKAYRVLSRKAGLSTPKNTWSLMRSHNMHKFFKNAIPDEFNSDIVEFMMGHSLGKVKDAYYRANPDRIKEFYAKVYPYLTVEKALDVAESPEYRAIKHENRILQVETARHVVERSELSELRRELEEQKKRQNDFSELMELLQANPEMMLKAIANIKK